MVTFTIRKLLLIASALLLTPCWAIEFVTTDFNIEQGKPFTIEWEGANGPVQLLLKRGESNNLETVSVIYSGDSATSYTWTPPDLLLAGTYAFQISDSNSVNYSPQWEYDYAANGPASTAPSSPTTTTAPSLPSPTTATTTMLTTTFTTKPSTTTSATSSPKATTTSASTPTSTSDPVSSADNSESTSSNSQPTSTTSVASTSQGSPSSEPTDPSSGSNSSSSPGSSPSPHSSSSSSTSSTGTQHSDAGGLSTGAKIGIGLGAGVGGLVLIGVALFLVFRRGKAVGQRTVAAGHTWNHESKAELGDDPWPRAELGGQGIAEMHSGHDGWRGQPSELDALT